MLALVLVTQSYLTLQSMDCSPPGSSLHGILQARLLEWVAIPFSRGSSQPWDRTPVSCIAGRFFTIWATREAQMQRGECGKRLLMSTFNKALASNLFLTTSPRDRAATSWNINLVGIILSHGGWNWYPLERYLEPEILRFYTSQA